MLKHFLLILTLTITLYPKSSLKLRGKLTNDLTLLHYHNQSTNDSTKTAALNQLALTFKTTKEKSAKIEGNILFKLPYGKGYPISSQNDYLLVSKDSSIASLEIRKLYTSLYLPFGDLSLGRQIINFGKGKVFSPVDVFSKVEILDINLQRTGSDVVQFLYPISDLWGANVITEIPQEEKEHSSAFKLFGTSHDIDLSALVIRRNVSEEWLTGATLKGDLLVGLYGEALYHFPKDSSLYFEGMVGVDYSIRNIWIFQAEYLYNGNTNRQKTFGMVQYIVNELLSTGTSLLYTLSEESLIGSFNVSYNVLQNADIIFYIRGYNNYAPIEDYVWHDVDYSLRIETTF